MCWHIEWICNKIADEMSPTNVQAEDSPLPDPVSSAEAAPQLSPVASPESPPRKSLFRQQDEEVAEVSKKRNSNSRRVTRSQSSIQPAILQGSSKSVEKLQQKTPTSQMWDVASLLGRRLNADLNLFEYLVHWKGYPHSYDQWEPISNLECDDLIMEFELAHVGDDGIAAAMIACGFVAPTAEQVIRYRDTQYFLVPYGQGNLTTFCIVGPDKEKIEMKCLNSSGVIHHKQHAKLVVQSINKADSPFAPLSIDQILTNKNKHKHTISAGIVSYLLVVLFCCFRYTVFNANMFALIYTHIMNYCKQIHAQY